MSVVHLHGVALDRDAPLALQVHIIQGLFLQVAVRYRAGGLQQPVRERTLAVVDMGDNTKIPNILHAPCLNQACVFSFHSFPLHKISVSMHRHDLRRLVLRRSVGSI
jgi:hypothetical protein